MKSRMKCFSVLALIAFGVGYSDLLVRPSLAGGAGGHCHWDYTCTIHDSHSGNNFQHVIDLAVSLYEWLDSGGDPDDYDSSGTISVPDSSNLEGGDGSTTSILGGGGGGPGSDIASTDGPSGDEGQPPCYPVTSSDPSDVCPDDD